MRRLAARDIERMRRTAPRQREVVARRPDRTDLVFSARFLQIGGAVLALRNVSALEKRERADREMIDDAVLARVRLFALIAGLIVVLVAAVATVFGPLWLIALAALAWAPAAYAWHLRAILAAAPHARSAHYLEIVMNSGRTHRLHAGSEETADSLLSLLRALIAGDDDGTVYRLDARTGLLVVDTAAPAVTDMQLGPDVWLEPAGEGPAPAGS